MKIRRRIAAQALGLAMLWASGSSALELYRAWRALPPTFERIPGGLRWHDRETRRLRTFLAGAGAAVPPSLGPWCWSAPGVPEERRGEVYHWASFLAAAHDLIPTDEGLRLPCAVEVRYDSLAGANRELGADPGLVFDTRLGTVRVVR